MISLCRNRDFFVNNIAFVVLVVLMIFSTNCFNMLGWSLRFTRGFYIGFSAIIILFHYATRKYRVKINSFFDRYISFIIWWPLISCVLAFVCYGGELLKNYNYSFMWSSFAFVYYILHRFEIKERTIIRFFLVFALAGLGIQIFEQLFPSKAIFGVLDPNSEGYNGSIAYVRNNLFRLNIKTSMVSLVAMFFCWQKLIEKFSVKWLVLFLAFCVSVYLYLTRQVMIASAGVVACSFLFIKGGKQKIFAIALVVIVCLVLYGSWDSLFGGFVSEYQKNTYSTDVRLEFFDFLIPRLFEDPVGLIIGHGHLSVEYLWSLKYGYFLSDLGFLGEAWYLGIIWIIPYFMFMYKIVYKKRKELPLYVKMYMWCFFAICVMIFPYRYMNEMLVWSCLLYISSLHLKKDVIT